MAIVMQEQELWHAGRMRLLLPSTTLPTNNIWCTPVLWHCLAVTVRT